MNERLLQAERTLAVGLLDEAERLYRVALDEAPRSAVATLGLARIAGERGDEAEAYRLASLAVELDPANEAAVALVMRLHEILAGRGQHHDLPSAVRRRATTSTQPDGERSGGLPGRLLRRLLGRGGR